MTWSEPGLRPGCRTEWQLFSGWRVVCNDRQGAALPQTAQTDPEQSEPPVQQAVRRKSVAAAKPTQADQRKSVAAANPTQADQHKPTAAAKPAKTDPWKAMDPDADAVQAAKQKPTAAAKPAKSDPWKAAGPDAVQATQQKSSSAITQPTQTDPWKTAGPLSQCKLIRRKLWPTLCSGQSSESHGFPVPGPIRRKPWLCQRLIRANRKPRHLLLRSKKFRRLTQHLMRRRTWRQAAAMNTTSLVDGEKNVTS